MEERARSLGAVARSPTYVEAGAMRVFVNITGPVGRVLESRRIQVGQSFLNGGYNSISWTVAVLDRTFGATESS